MIGVTAAERLQETEASTSSRRLWIDALLVLAIYAFLWPKVTGDMSDFLVPWLNVIVHHGPFGAFGIPFSNYNPPYLYLMALFSPLVAILPKVSVIKSLSLVGTLLLILAGRQLLRSVGRGQQPEAMLRLLLLPSVAINAACFGQCDAFWSAACLMAVACAIERRPVAMLVWFGIGVAFKAQAVFLGPFILLRLLQERTPMRFWGLPVLVFAVALLPAALAGWPVSDLATIYLRQAEWNPQFISTAANPWAIVQVLAPVAGTQWFWFGSVAAAVAAGAFVITYRSHEGEAADLLALALLSACLMPFLLPKMHERFFFLADVLAFLLAFIRQDRKSMGIFFLVQGASVLALIGIMAEVPLLSVLGCFMVLGAILMLIDQLHMRTPILPTVRDGAELQDWQSRAPA